MEFLHAILDAVIVVAAHITTGLFAAPLKYEKRVCVLIWCAWGVVQTALFIPMLTTNPSTELSFLVGFVLPYSIT